MVTTRLTPRRARSRLAADPEFGECLQHQRAKRPATNRRLYVGLESEVSLESGNNRTLSPG